MQTLVSGALGAAALVAFAMPVSAHVSFETAEAAADAGYKAVLRVPHGCKGEATRTVRVEIPDGVIEVKPMPKPGWTLATSRAPYPKSYQVHGRTVSEGVKAIVWSGGELPDAFYDEFVFQAQFTGELAGKSVPIPVVQECASGAERWIEIAAEGQNPHSLKAPAPIVKVKAPALAGKSYKVGAITVEAPWSRATPGGAQVAGGFMRITNTGTTPDRLVGGTSSIAGRFQLHAMSMTDNVMRMRELDNGLEIKPGQTVELKPGGYHAMLLDLKAPLKEGDTIKGTLVFEKAGPVEVEYGVRSIAARGEEGEHRH
jgi:uncharacterized protein YcnI